MFVLWKSSDIIHLVVSVDVWRLLDGDGDVYAGFVWLCVQVRVYMFLWAWPRHPECLATIRANILQTQHTDTQHCTTKCTTEEREYAYKQRDGTFNTRTRTRRRASVWQLRECSSTRNAHAIFVHSSCNRVAPYMTYFITTTTMTACHYNYSILYILYRYAMQQQQQHPISFVSITQFVNPSHSFVARRFCAANTYKYNIYTRA